MHPRTVVLVGCSRGVGLAILEHLAESPKSKAVVGMARKSEDVLLLQRKFQSNPRILILTGDVTDADAMKQVASEVERAGLSPDLLICNAGILTNPKPFDEIPLDDLVNTLSVNVVGPFNTMRAFLPLMRNIPGAVMVNVSSGWGLFGAAGEATYCASKHALEGLVKCAAQDVELDAVSIVTVRPGVVCTDLLATACGGPAEARRRGLPLERFAQPFCDKIMAITKAQSGQHVDCAYDGPRDW